MKKPTASVSRCATLIVASLLISFAGRAQQTLDPETQAKILKGLAIAPVPLNMTGKDPSMIGYGSYLRKLGRRLQRLP
jgi:hypothetical protein